VALKRIIFKNNNKKPDRQRDRQINKQRGKQTTLNLKNFISGSENSFLHIFEGMRIYGLYGKFGYVQKLPLRSIVALKSENVLHICSNYLTAKTKKRLVWTDFKIVIF